MLFLLQKIGLQITGGGSLKSLLVRIVFWAESFGRAKIYYCLGDDGSVIHTSYVHPKTVKFPFLDSDDYVIGPCQTVKAFRGQGYYPRVLRYIAMLPEYAGRNIYIFVNEDNHASVRGIEKAGFKFCGTLVCEGILKRYKWLRKN